MLALFMWDKGNKIINFIQKIQNQFIYIALVFSL